MTKDEFINELGRIFDVFDDEKLTEETPLKSLANFDSVGMLNLIALFSEDLGIDVNVDVLRKARTVRELMELAHIDQ